MAGRGRTKGQKSISLPHSSVCWTRQVNSTAKCIFLPFLTGLNRACWSWPLSGQWPLMIHSQKACAHTKSTLKATIICQRTWMYIFRKDFVGQTWLAGAFRHFSGKQLTSEASLQQRGGSHPLLATPLIFLKAGAVLPFHVSLVLLYASFSLREQRQLEKALSVLLY